VKKADVGRGDFETGHGKSEAENFEAERAKRHSKIGQLAVEVDFLTKMSRQPGLRGNSSNWSTKIILI